MRVLVPYSAGVLSSILALAAGCGGDHETGSGTAAQCAGTYAGTYGGDTTGTLAGTLGEDGTIEVTFTETGSTSQVSGTGQLAGGGNITLEIGGNQVSGQLNDQCHAAGT